MPEDGNGEVTELKDTLKEIESNNLFSQDKKKRNFFKRDTSDLTEEHDTDDAESEVDSDTSSGEKKQHAGEGRKWRKKSRANKRKRQKHQNAESSKQEDSAEDEEREKEKKKSDAFTNGIQFSAYSGHEAQAQKQAAKAYQRTATSAPERQEQNMLMYGMDGQGNPQYIDEDVVSLLLQNPQAKKVNKKTKIIAFNLP